MIEFSLTEEQKQLQTTARKFADEVMTPIAQECDEHHRFPREVFEQAFELGLINLGIPSHLGGIGLGTLDQVIVCEELAAGCTGMVTSIIANDRSFLPILIGGSEEPEQQFGARF